MSCPRKEDPKQSGDRLPNQTKMDSNSLDSPQWGLMWSVAPAGPGSIQEGRKEERKVCGSAYT